MVYMFLLFVKFDIGRIWAGHNILRFDCPRLREAFVKINRPAPEPKGTIDSLALLTQRFGRRAGDMKVLLLSTLSEVARMIIHRQILVMYLWSAS